MSHKNRPLIKGGKVIPGKLGYARIRINGKYMRLNRFLMEKKIGRKLTKYEVVHHINDNPFDDRIENLELMVRSKHIEIHNRKRKYKPHTEETKRRISKTMKRRMHDKYSNPGF